MSMMRAAAGATRVGGMVLALVLSGAVLASEPEARSPSQVLMWLEKAHQAASMIEAAPEDSPEADQRNFALSTVAVACFDLGEIEKGKAIAAKLPENDRKNVLIMLPITLAHKGEFDRAVLEAKAVDTPMALALV